MFKFKAPDGTYNLCGKKVAKLRAEHNPSLTQHELAKQLQSRGYNIETHSIQSLELGERFITDIELVMLAKFFNVSFEELLTINSTST